MAVLYVRMKPLGPYTIDKKGYLTIAHASKIIGGAVTVSTLWTWAKKHCTPWGLALDVVHQRPAPDTTWHNKKAPRRKPGDFRMLLREEMAFVLRDLLQEHRRDPHRPSRLTNDELADLETATRHYRRRQNVTTPNF